MTSIFTLVFGNIKRRKKQNILILIIIFAAATMLFSALGLLLNINGLVEDVLEEHATSHYSLRFNQQYHDANQIEEFWSNNNETEGVYTVESLIRDGKVFYEGRSIPTPELVITNAAQKHTQQDILKFIEGEQTHVPGETEVWVTTAFAYRENVIIGDKLKFIISGQDERDYTVSAILFDPLYSNDFMPPRFWVSPQTFESLAGDIGSIDYIMGIRLTDYSNASAVWGKFQSALDGQYIGHVLNYDSIMMGYSTLYNIMGGSILGFSFILMLIAVFVVFTVLKRNIASEISTIGILKAQGFSSGQIKWAYMMQYILITLCAMLLALIAGSQLLFFAGNIVLKNLGRDGSGMVWHLPYLITLCLMAIATVLSTITSTLKIRRIKPSEAIRYNGHISIKNKSTALKASFIDNLPIPFVLAIKQMFLKKGQSFFIMLVAMFTAFTIFYGVSGIASLNRSFDNMAFWGADNRDITMMTSYTEQEDVERIEEALWKAGMVNSFSGYREAPAAISRTAEHETRNLAAMIYSNFDAVGIINIEGRNPEYENEVSISTVLAEDYGKAVGDTMQIFIGGEESTFLITGIYQTVLHMGGNIRLHSSAIDKMDGISLPNSLLVVLNEGVTSGEFTEYFDNVFAQYNVTIDDMSEIQGVFDTMSEVMEPIMLAISILFVLIMLLILTNYVFINVLEFRKEFGIYKSLGMTNAQIRGIMIINFSILTFISSVLSVGVGILVVPRILLMTMGAFGFESFPFTLPVTQTLLIAPLATLFVMACTWVAGKGVERISPRELIVE